MCGRCGLGDSERQVAQALGQRICGVVIVGLRDREEVVDRLAAIEHPDLDRRPVLIFPAGVVRRRCDHAQAAAVRHKSSKMINVLDVVEDDEPVGGSSGL